VQEESTFQIYNASAGSGKTFTLVKEYLKVVLVEDDIFVFQKILAITFTNKAASEMKQRVLSSLKEFSEGKNSHLFTIIQKETGLDTSVIIKKSKKILQVILQNYGAFHITTIDSFTFKIIKSFAYDLGISQGFEVEMNTQDLLNKAVEVLISRIGTNEELTNTLIEYSLDKVDDDKSWDISRDLSEFSRILLKEQDIAHFRKLSDKSLQDFKRVQQKLRVYQKEVIAKMSCIGEEALKIIENKSLEYKDFYRSMLPNHFLSLINKTELTNFFDQSALKKRIDEQIFYSKSKSAHTIALIKDILPEILKLYNESEVLYQQLVQNKLILKSIIPLAVLNNINLELTSIKEENNIRLNAEFNQLISDNIQEQPAPFIYERIGQKFLHYFIDEMQDTSVLQWKNLIPLIANSLAQENTSLLLVGDGKQAIYRWRGGKAEQFIELGSENEVSKNIFLTQKKVKELSVNYRSFSEIVNFNNSFFQYISKFIQNPSYANLYLNKSYQEENNNKGGFVSISLLEKSDDTKEEDLKYAKKVYQVIQQLGSEVCLGSVCVLVRKRSEGVVIANYLSENNLEIVSSETLLLNNSKKVNFIISFLKYTLNSNDKESLLDVLYYLYSHLQISIDKHAFFIEFLGLEFQEVVELLKKYNCSFDVLTFNQLPLYEKVEHIIRSFRLQGKTNAYIQFFLDEVLTNQQKKSSIQDFLDFWELKKESLSVVTSENLNAVKIMTIHKSKGLEFPIVIFPCDLNIYHDIKPKAWLENDLNNFPKVLVSLTKEIQYANKKGEEIYNKRREALELDSFNLLYVALTRAVEQLYIITDKKLKKEGVEDFNFYSGIFISFLKENKLWIEDKNDYTFGSPVKLIKVTDKETASKIQDTFISTPWKNHNINLLANSSTFWGSKRGDAKEYGTLIHKILSEIITKADVCRVVEKYVQKGDLHHEKKNQLQQLILEIISHAKLKYYYSEDVTVYNERDVFYNNQIVIPDRLVFDDQKRVAIIDYKTGVSKEEHYSQLENYGNVLESLSYSVDKKILVYINETISVEEL
tara:strand:- start:3666 stop:6788 length:3123 start_codon:yes stop_codon:yes gene_type:complete